MKSKLKNFIPAILFMIVIFYFSSQPGDVSDGKSLFIVNIIKTMGFRGPVDVDRANFLVRKLAHITEYTILCILFVRGFLKSNYRRSVLYGGIMSLIYAMTDEIHQIFVPGRAGKAMDVVIDSIGILIGMAIVMVKLRFSKHNK